MTRLIAMIKRSIQFSWLCIHDEMSAILMMAIMISPVNLFVLIIPIFQKEVLSTIIEFFFSFVFIVVLLPVDSLNAL